MIKRRQTNRRRTEKNKRANFPSLQIIFGRECVSDIATASTVGDEFYEASEKVLPGAVTKGMFEIFHPINKNIKERQMY